jgi:hypothetical protein
MVRSADLAGTFRGDADAPIPDVRVTTVERLKSTLSGRSGQRRNRVSGQRLGFRKWRGFD